MDSGVWLDLRVVKGDSLAFRRQSRVCRLDSRAQKIESVLGKRREQNVRSERCRAPQHQGRLRRIEIGRRLRPFESLNVPERYLDPPLEVLDQQTVVDQRYSFEHHDPSARVDRDYSHHNQEEPSAPVWGGRRQIPDDGGDPPPVTAFQTK
jgi:hypothetical protein